MPGRLAGLQPPGRAGALALGALAGLIFGGVVGAVAASIFVALLLLPRPRESALAESAAVRRTRSAPPPPWQLRLSCAAKPTVDGIYTLDRAARDPVWKAEGRPALLLYACGGRLAVGTDRNREHGHWTLLCDSAAVGVAVGEEAQVPARCFPTMSPAVLSIRGVRSRPSGGDLAAHLITEHVLPHLAPVDLRACALVCRLWWSALRCPAAAGLLARASNPGRQWARLAGPWLLDRAAPVRDGVWAWAPQKTALCLTFPLDDTTCEAGVGYAGQLPGGCTINAVHAGVIELSVGAERCWLHRPEQQHGVDHTILHLTVGTAEYESRWEDTARLRRPCSAVVAKVAGVGGGSVRWDAPSWQPPGALERVLDCASPGHCAGHAAHHLSPHHIV